MRDYEAGPAGENGENGPVQLPGVASLGGGLVEECHLRVGEQHPREGELLCLASVIDLALRER